MSRYDDPGEPESPAPQEPDATRPSDAEPASGPVRGRQPAARTRQSAGPRPARRPGRRWIGGRYSSGTIALGGLATLLAVVLVSASLTVYVKYREVWDSINKVDVSADLHGSRPPADPNAINLLLIGSDSRVGRNGAIGGRTGIGGARSDTVMVVHIAPGAHQVVVISIPRDSVVPILACAPEAGTTGQTAQPGAVEQINSTFAYGGPGCLWETIEHTTGIRLDDFVAMTFVGFERAIDALHGVEVCLPAAVNDPMSGLDLTAGRHRIYGAQAVAFWRTREDLGMGDDPQRIQRDQFLMAALFQGIKGSGLLNSPTRMLGVIDALTRNRNITIDDQLTPGRLLQIGEALHGISGDSVQFVTVPWTTYAPNAAWVQWLQPNAGRLFSAIAHDTRLPKVTKIKKGKRGKRGAVIQPATTVSIQASQVQVSVLNGTTTHGLAASTGTALTARGFKVIGQPTDAATSTYTHSVIEYATAAQLPAAQFLAKQVGPAGDIDLQLDAQLSATSPLQLILGSTFSSLQRVQPAPTSSATIQNIAGTYGGITGGVNICNDQAAFAGPDGE
jgi:LCP family protein required for cell wall assembly